MAKTPAKSRAKAPAQPRKRGRKEGWTVEDVGRALALSGGIANRAAKKLGCDPTTVRRYIDRHPELIAIQEECKEGLKDDAEDQLARAVRRGEGWAIKFFLLTQGRDRGYVDRKEVTGADGTPLGGGRSNQVVVIQVPDNRRDQIEAQQPVIDVPCRVIEDKSNG